MGVCDKTREKEREQEREQNGEDQSHGAKQGRNSNYGIPGGGRVSPNGNRQQNVGKGGGWKVQQVCVCGLARMDSRIEARCVAHLAGQFG